MTGIIISAVTFAISSIICFIVGGSFSYTDNKLLFIPVYLAPMAYVLYDLFSKKDTNEADSSSETGEKKLTFAEKRAEKKRLETEKREQLRIEREKREKEEQEKERIRKAKEQAEQEKRISYFENSEATKKIVEYIRTKSGSTPYTIHIYNSGNVSVVSFDFEGGSDAYNFAKHQLKSFKMPDDTKVFQRYTSSKEISDYFFSKWSKKNDVYCFAVAINRHFNNAFQLKENFHGDYMPGDYLHDYDELGEGIIARTETTITCRMGSFSVKMTREMRSF